MSKRLNKEDKARAIYFINVAKRTFEEVFRNTREEDIKRMLLKDIKEAHKLITKLS